MVGTQLSRREFDEKLANGDFKEPPLVRRRDWSEPYYGWQEVSGVLKSGDSVWCKAYPTDDHRNALVD